MPIHIITASIFALIAYKYGDLKNWKAYYSTILFLAFGDLMYAFLFQKKLLWVWHSPYLDDTLIEVLWIFVLFPSLVLIYLPNYLKKDTIVNKFFYVLTWIVSFSALEWVIHLLGGIIYKNGWQFHSSVIFYCLMFPTLSIHYAKPLLAVLLSSVWVIVTMLVFHVPL